MSGFSFFIEESAVETREVPVFARSMLLLLLLGATMELFVRVSERLLSLASERRLPSRIEPDVAIDGAEPPPPTAPPRTWLSSRVAGADNCRSSGAPAGVVCDVGSG